MRVSCCPLAFLLSSNLGTELLGTPRRDAQAGLEFRIGLSGSRRIDVPNSKQGLAVKADERVLSEGSINRFRVAQRYRPGPLLLFQGREYLRKQHLGTGCK